MPEAPIHEHGELVLGKGEVRLAFNGVVSAPSGDVVRSKQFGQCDLRVLVAFAPYAGHDFGALLLREDVVSLSV